MARLTVWNPWNEMLALSSAMDRMDQMERLNNPARGTHTSQNTRRTFGMPLNLSETTEHYVVQAELPGFNANDIAIDFADNALNIRAERQAQEQAEGVTHHVVERVHGLFARSVRFPNYINAENITASYENGVLTVQVPKAEQAKSRRINVQAQA